MASFFKHECPNCGAKIRGDTCAYCGTVFDTPPSVPKGFEPLRADTLKITRRIVYSFCCLVFVGLITFLTIFSIQQNSKETSHTLANRSFLEEQSRKNDELRAISVNLEEGTSCYKDETLEIIYAGYTLDESSHDLKFIFTLFNGANFPVTAKSFYLEINGIYSKNAFMSSPWFALPKSSGDSQIIVWSDDLAGITAIDRLAFDFEVYTFSLDVNDIAGGKKDQRRLISDRIVLPPEIRETPSGTDRVSSGKNESKENDAE
jgi:hypothetical protein